MNTKNLSAVTTDLIEAYGNTAKNVIGAYRAGSERVVVYLGQRWDSAFKATSAKLSPDVQNNAQNAQRMAEGFYSKGLNMTTQGAELVVNKMVELASGGVQQVAANATRFEEKTGVKALNQIASAVVPVAAVVGRLASQLEQKSCVLASRISGDSHATAAVKRGAMAFKKARAKVSRVRKAA